MKQFNLGDQGESMNFLQEMYNFGYYVASKMKVIYESNLAKNLPYTYDNLHDERKDLQSYDSAKRKADEAKDKGAKKKKGKAAAKKGSGLKERDQASEPEASNDDDEFDKGVFRDKGIISTLSENGIDVTVALINVRTFILTFR